MVVKKNGHEHPHYAGATGKADTAEISERLAPPEEKAVRAANQSSKNGGMIVDTSGLKVPNDFAEQQKAGSRFFGLEPVVIVILCLSLAFIAFIAWQISTMPLSTN